MSDARISPTEKAQLIEAVRSAGAYLLSLWPAAGDAGEHLNITAKGDGTLVSTADLGSNELLVEALSTLFPQDTILSEEIEPDCGTLAASSRTWVIDPLDGTKCFLNGTDEFSILVALCENHDPTFGIQFFPARQQLVVASGAGEQRSTESLCQCQRIRQLEAERCTSVTSIARNPNSLAR